MFLRLLTSAELRGNPDEYSGFLFNEEVGLVDVPTFCASQVDPVGKEAGERFLFAFPIYIIYIYMYVRLMSMIDVDHVQVLALARALKVNLKLAYLDGRQATQARDPSPAAPSSVGQETAATRSAKGKDRGTGKGERRETTAVEIHLFQYDEEKDEVGVVLLYR